MIQKMMQFAQFAADSPSHRIDFYMPFCYNEGGTARSAHLNPAVLFLEKAAFCPAERIWTMKKACSILLALVFLLVPAQAAFAQAAAVRIDAGWDIHVPAEPTSY